MLDTVGPELQVYNKTADPIELKADDIVTITPDATKEPSAEVLPISYSGLAGVRYILIYIVILENQRNAKTTESTWGSVK